MTSLDAYQQHPLHRFLYEHECARPEDATTTGMGDIRGKWLIPDEEYQTLLNHLHDYLFVKGHRALGFVEQPRLNKSKPLLQDLDFDYSKSNALSRKFDETHLRAFCNELKNALDHFFDLSVYEQLRFFVTLRPQPYDNKDKIKDGIHILCPEFTLLDEKWNVIRKYLLNKGVVRSIFGDTEYTNIDSKVYDAAMGRKQGWMFYGASKASIPAYALAHVFTFYPSTNEWVDEEVDSYTPRELLELMSVRYKIDDDINVLKDEAKEEYEELKHTAQILPVTTPAVTTAMDALAATLPITGGELSVIEKMTLQCLKPERADGYESWIRVGWCLHNICANEAMFNLWMDFSKLSPKFNSNDLGQLRRDWFHGMRKEGDGPRLGIRSLYKWARDDNLEKYKEIINEDTCEYVIHQTDATHYHIAKLMQKMYGSVFIASVNNRNTDWFHYDENMNMWRHLKQGMELRQKICTDVADQIQRACDKEGKLLYESNNPGDKESHASKLKMMHEMQMKLYNSGFSDSVMKMASVIFFEDEFANKLNINPNLFGCANGILELRAKSNTDSREHVIFRQGRPEDYVSFLGGRNHPETEAINYVPYDPNDPRQHEIADFLDKLFPNKELRRHVLKLLASCLEGMNREQFYYFFTGAGSNGKSRLITLMKFVLGDYQTSVAATVLTRKRPESGAANPDIMRMKGKRFIYSQEPDDREPLNTSRMKQFSGEDMIEARGLFQDQESFKIMGKMFMMCNTKPPINSMDEGTWRRIRVVPFESQFRRESHPDYIAKKPNIYLIDENLDEKMLNWREPFLALLVHIFETQYIPEGLMPEPGIIKEASDKYKSDHDTFAKFRGERIRELRDGFQEVTHEQVSLKDIARCYKRWATATGAKQMSLSELENRCEEAFGDSRGRKLYTHIRVFLEDEEIDKFDADHAGLGTIAEDLEITDD